VHPHVLTKVHAKLTYANPESIRKLRLRREALLTKSHAERLLLQYQFTNEFESRKRNLDASLLGIKMAKLAGQKIYRNPLLSLAVLGGLLIFKPQGS